MIVNAFLWRFGWPFGYIDGYICGYNAGMGKEMCAQNGLLKRPNGFYFQARVPKDCREQIGKDVIREKLTATTLTEAKAQVRQQWVAFHERIDQLRAGVSTDPTEADIQRWTDSLLAFRLGHDEKMRMEGLDEDDFSAILSGNDFDNAGMRAALARGDTRYTNEDMEEFLVRRFGVKLLPNTEAYKKTSYAFLKAEVRATEMLLARNRGEVVDTPKEPDAKRLYKNIDLILDRIQRRHERYIIDIEAQRGSTYEIAKLFHKGDQSPVHWPARPLNKENVGDEYLFYLSTIAYRGGLVRNIGLIFPNPEYAIEVLDYMINEREYPPALFLKGVMYKYGLRPEDLPNLREAKGMLDAAANKGVGGATIELRQFDVHERLNKYDQAIKESYRRYGGHAGSV